MRDLQINEIQEVNGGNDWGQIGAGIGLIGLGIAIVGTGGLAGIPVALAGAATAGEITVALAALGASGIGGFLLGDGFQSDNDDNGATSGN